MAFVGLEVHQEGNQELMDFNKSVLITGGSSGIGKQIAADLLRLGARVTIVADKLQRLEEAAAELSAISPLVESVECDVGNQGSVERMKEYVMSKHGCPDILINNAGFATYRTFNNTNVEEIEQLVNVNLIGPMRCARAFLPFMVERRSGIIVNMASIAGRLIITPNSVYCSSLVTPMSNTLSCLEGRMIVENRSKIRHRALKDRCDANDILFAESL